MATERLRVILEMVTGQYKRGAREAANATDAITKSGNAASGALAGVRNRLNNITPAQAAGIVAAGGVITVQAARAVKALDDLGIQADAIRNRFDTVFGDAAEDVRDWTDDVNERFGLSEVAVQDLANGIGDLLVPLGFTRQEAADLSTEALTLANALSEWSGGQIEVADSAERIRKALLGERESLEALGVKVLQSDVNARLAAQGQSQLTGELRAQAEAQATLAIITEKSADAINAYEAGANEALIAQKNLNAAFADSQQALGDFVSNEVDDFRGVLPVLAFALEDVTAALNDTNDASNETAEGGDGLAISLLRLLPAVEGVRQGVQPLVNRYLEAKFAVDEAARSTDAYSDRLTQQAQQFDTVGDEAEQTATSIAKVVRETVNLGTELRKQADPVFRAVNAFQSYQEVLEQVDEDGQRTAEELLDLADAIIDSEEALRDLGGGNLDRGINAIAEALDLSAQSVRDLLRELGILDGTSVRVLIEGQVTGIGSVVSGNDIAESIRFGNLKPRAFGGAVAAGDSYLLGERGPEFFTPNVSGRISSGPLGGATENVVINLNVTTEPGFSNQVVREMDQALSRYRSGVS